MSKDRESMSPPKEIKTLPKPGSQSDLKDKKLNKHIVAMGHQELIARMPMGPDGKVAAPPPLHSKFAKYSHPNRPINFVPIPEGFFEKKKANTSSEKRSSLNNSRSLSIAELEDLKTSY